FHRAIAAHRARARGTAAERTHVTNPARRRRQEHETGRADARDMAAERAVGSPRSLLVVRPGGRRGAGGRAARELVALCRRRAVARVAAPEEKDGGADEGQCNHVTHGKISWLHGAPE